MTYTTIFDTIQGKKDSNEDTIIVDEEQQIFVLADGMGGHNQGKTASYLTAHNMYLEMSEIRKMLEEKQISKKELPEVLRSTINFTNTIISAAAEKYEQLKKQNEFTSQIFISQDKNTPLYYTLQNIIEEQNQELDNSKFAELISGMGTTLDVCMIYDDIAYISHVGNGRVYKASYSVLEKLTQEHLNYPENIGFKEKNNAVFQSRLGLSSYIGKSGVIQIDSAETKLEKGDMIMLATDGITHTLTKKDIIYALKEEGRTKETIRRIIQNPMRMAEQYARIRGCNLESALEKVKNKDDASYIVIRRR